MGHILFRKVAGGILFEAGGYIAEPLLKQPRKVYIERGQGGGGFFHMEI